MTVCDDCDVNLICESCGEFAKDCLCDKSIADWLCPVCDEEED